MHAVIDVPRDRFGMNGFAAVIKLSSSNHSFRLAPHGRACSGK
jgi:hypothetical protein